MSVTGVELREPQDTLADGEAVVAELTNGTRLIRTDEGTGIVRPPVDSGFREGEFDRWADARLFFGLLLEVGGWWRTPPESPSQNIPLAVAREGTDAIAAYLLVGTGTVGSRGYVADALDVTEQTVSNYANRIRWSDDE